MMPEPAAARIASFIKPLHCVRVRELHYPRRLNNCRRERRRSQSRTGTPGEQMLNVIMTPARTCHNVRRAFVDVADHNYNYDADDDHDECAPRYWIAARESSMARYCAASLCVQGPIRRPPH